MEETPQDIQRQPQVSKFTHLEVQLIPIKYNKTYQNVPYLTKIVVSLCLASFYFGFSLTFLSNVSTNILSLYFTSAVEKSSVQGGLIGALPVGAAVGALLAPIFMRFVSRKQFMIIFNCMAIMIAGIIQINNLVILFVCKLLQGFIVGNFMAMTPIYINELVPVQIQGIFGAFTQLFVCIAVFLCYLFGVIFTVSNTDGQFIWRFLFSFTGLTCIIQSSLLLFNFIPQSPVSLIQAGRIEEAREVLGRFNTPEVLNKVLQQTIAKVESTKSSEILDQTEMVSDPQSPKKINQNNPSQQKFSIPISLKAVFLGFQLPFMQQMSGTNAIVTQIGSIVHNYDPQMAIYSGLIANGVQLIATVFSVLALAHFGRRSLILFGNLSLGVIDILVGIMFLVVALTQWTPAVIIALVLIMLFMCSYGVTIGPTVWLYVPQIIPANLVPPATFMNWFGCSICVIFTPIVINEVGSPYPVFFFFGGLTLIFFVFNYFLVVETKGLSLVQIASKMS